MSDKYIPKVGDIFKVVCRLEICTCLCTRNGIFASYDRIGRICFDPGSDFQKISEDKTMTKHTIEIEGLPRGWMAIAYRVPQENDKYGYQSGHIIELCSLFRETEILIVERTKPREITLVETDEVFVIRQSGYRVYSDGTVQYIENAMGSDIGEKIWRVKEE